MLMSAVGSIFTLMNGSGIEEGLGCLYGSNTNVHTMSDKAIARALRALHLLDAALRELQASGCNFKNISALLIFRSM